ncbi:hypothetical protein QPK87_04520 [Kamptonema cortianum]|nr:hypothetical protein [Kamptonema cortianum]
MTELKAAIIATALIGAGIAYTLYAAKDGKLRSRTSIFKYEIQSGCRVVGYRASPMQLLISSTNHAFEEEFLQREKFSVRDEFASGYRLLWMEKDNVPYTRKVRLFPDCSVTGD